MVFAKFVPHGCVAAPAKSHVIPVSYCKIKWYYILDLLLRLALELPTFVPTLSMITLACIIRLA